MKREMRGQRRDNWSYETVRALRKKVKHLRDELVIQAGAYGRHRQRLTYWINRSARAERSLKDLQASLDRGIEESMIRQENAWYRGQIEYLLRWKDRQLTTSYPLKEQYDQELRYVGAWAKNILDRPLVPFNVDEPVLFPDHTTEEALPS